MNSQLTIPALAGFLAGLLANALPRVDLLPEEIGLGTVFAFAGAGACIGLLSDFARGARDERWVRRMTLVGLLAGAAFLVAVAVLRSIL